MEPAADVTIILPVRNAERWVFGALSNLEVVRDGADLIVVDDGSDDGTGQLLQQWRRPWLRVVQGQGRGLARALNAGLAHVRRPIVARHDVDDIALPGRFAIPARLLAERDEVVACATAFEDVADDGAHVQRPPTGSRELRHALLKANPLAHGSMTARTDVLHAIGGYRDGFRFGQDHDLWLRLASVGELACVPDVLYRRFTRGQRNDQKRRRQAYYSTRALAAHALRSGELSVSGLARNAASACWVLPRPWTR